MHPDALLKDLTRISVTASELDKLANEHGLLVSAIPPLDQMYVSLVRHQFNYNWWHKQAGEGNVVEFHHRYLEGATQ